MQIEHQQGYLVLAQNNDTTDYVSCARALAHSIRRVEPDAKICLLTDVDTAQDRVFDIVKTFPMGDRTFRSNGRPVAFLPVPLYAQARKFPRAAG